MYYVYIIRCSDNSLYTGVASDAVRRLREHFEKSKKRAKYTKSHTPISLEALWLCKTKSDALKLEYRLKELTKVEKENLIKDNIAPVSICEKLQGMDFDRIDTTQIEF